MASKSTAFLSLFMITLTLLLLSFVAVEASCGEPSCSTPSPPPPPATSGTCPINMLNLAVCADVLQYVQLRANIPTSEQCCPLLQGLADADAAVCLCAAMTENVLGVVTVDVKVGITLLLNYCHKTCPPGFTCPLL